MDKANKIIIKETIAKVNRTLQFYEKDFISVQRTPWIDKERCGSFEQYIEARFNFEISRLPEFEYLSQVFEGRLFTLQDLKGSDPDQRKFKLVTFKLPEDEVIKETISPFPEMEVLIYEEIAKIKDYLGGNTIKFNAVKKKIKIIVENDC